MYGLIGRREAIAGQRDALIALMLENTEPMPNCLSDVVAHDAEDAHDIWITEARADQGSRAAALALSDVRDRIVQARPLIAGFDRQIGTRPVGGHCLAAATASVHP